MIIDCHTHIGRNEHITATAEDLIRSMDKSSIDKSLVFAGHINDCSNKWMMEQIKPYKDRLHGVASVNLTKIVASPGTTGASTEDMSIWDMLETLNAGAVAVKLYTGYEHFAPNSPRVRHIVEMVEKYNKPVIFHSGDCLASISHAKLAYSQPLDIDDIAVDFPNTKFVIAHMGFPWQRDAAEVCYKNKNVYADISGFVYGSFLDPKNSGSQEQFKKVVNEFRDICPADKLLFGTDFPISDQEGYFHALFNGWGSALTQEMLCANVQKVFNIQ